MVQICLTFASLNFRLCMIVFFSYLNNQDKACFMSKSSSSFLMRCLISNKATVWTALPSPPAPAVRRREREKMRTETKSYWTRKRESIRPLSRCLEKEKTSFFSSVGCWTRMRFTWTRSARLITRWTSKRQCRKQGDLFSVFNFICLFEIQSKILNIRHVCQLPKNARTHYRYNYNISML